MNLFWWPTFSSLIKLCTFSAEWFTVDSSITAEEYVSIACGPDFPIEYIRGEDYNKSR